MDERAAVIGDGQMGLVLASLFAEKDIPCSLWGPFAEEVELLARERRSHRRLPDLHIPPDVLITPDAGEALHEATVVIDAIPTQFIRGVWERIGAFITPRMTICSVSKGIEAETLLRPLQVVADVLGESHDLDDRPMVCLSGPTIAAELAERKPATLVAASHDVEAARRAQGLLGTHWLRVYTNEDVLGVEIAGATKNVIAIAAGVVDGMGLGFNAKSALLARGLAEIARLGAAIGARPETFFGVAGVGDLATTCFCPMGRNRTCGERIGRGESLEDILASTASVVEGVDTTKSVLRLAERLKVEMPITQTVHAILFEGLDLRDAIATLMEREPKAERVGR